MIDDQAKRRFMVMRQIYELTEGEESHAVHFNKIMEYVGFGPGLLRDIIYYLENEKLITFQDPGNLINITLAGTEEVEIALMEPDKATAHFPARGNTIAKQNMDLQMQQESYDRAHTITIGENRYNDLKELLQVIIASLDQLNLASEQKSKLITEINTIHSQMAFLKPSTGIIPESVAHIKRILESSARTPLEYELLTKITRIIG
ncbi:MAG: hypothetical protein PHD29_02590 [bacterium]|jgi:hypothetical protein|nr:hypothetical protein [bacterium]MDD5755966.1 hypothetical protein [bacterium]